MKVRLRDIAEATGYSVNTVSHALRDMPDISEATKQKIREAARRLDYIPDLRAGSFKSGRRGIIAVLLPDIINPHFTLLFHEIECYFRERGITPLFMNTAEDAATEEALTRVALGQNVDGVILCPTAGSTACPLLDRAGVPYVLVGRHLGEIADAVVTDDARGGALATAHLLARGHTRIACVRVDDRLSSDRERYAGYLAAHAAAGLTPDPGLTLHLALRGEGNAEAITAFLGAHPECTAIFAFSDLLATEIIATATSLGLHVPNDLSVVGYDRIADAYPEPLPLDTVGVEGETMGHAAAALLDARMTAARPAQKARISLPVCLKVGSSSRKF